MYFQVGDVGIKGFIATCDLTQSEVRSPYEVSLAQSTSAVSSYEDPSRDLIRRASRNLTIGVNTVGFQTSYSETTTLITRSAYKDTTSQNRGSAAAN